MPKLGSRRVLAKLLTRLGGDNARNWNSDSRFRPAGIYLRGPAPPFRDVYWLVAFRLLAIGLGITKANGSGLERAAAGRTTSPEPSPN